MAVRIVTDSTCDLPPEVVAEWGITIVPLTVRFGPESYRDGVDLSAGEFYSKLTSRSVLPTTAAPAPGVFAEIYQRYLAEGHQVLSLHISSKLSATYGSATNGKDQVGQEKPIEVVDTLTVSLGLGLLVLEAARAAGEGTALDEIAGMVRSRIPRVRLYGVFDTLEYLHKGGRIGAASAMLGSLLNLKPMVIVRDGEVHPLERVRTRAKAMGRLVELASVPNVERLGIMDATTPGDAADLAGRIAEAAPGKGIIRSRFGPVLGTYTGPGALGISFLEKG